jgi:hypothetical protein
MVNNITIGLYRFCWDTLWAVNSCGSCQPNTWIAEINPIRTAESVRLLTNKGSTVENEAKPRAKPKKPPSATLAKKLNGRFLVCLRRAGLRVAKFFEFSSGEVYHNGSGSWARYLTQNPDVTH